MRVDHGLQQTGKNFNVLYAVAAYSLFIIVLQIISKSILFYWQSIYKEGAEVDKKQHQERILLKEYQSKLKGDLIPDT